LCVCVCNKVSADDNTLHVQSGVTILCVCVCNKVSADDNTLHVQSGVTILTDGDFSEGEALFATTGACFYD